MSDSTVNTGVIDKKHDNEGAKIDIVLLLAEFVKAFFKFAWLVIILALIFGSLNYFRDAYNYKPVYRSQATFTVATSSSDSLIDNSYNFYYDSGKAEQLGLTFPHILSSQLLTDAIKEDLGIDYINATLSASTISDSNMVTMTAVSPVPADAKKILESAIRVYPDVARFVLGEIKFNIIDAPTMPYAPSNTINYRVSLIKGEIIGVMLGMALILMYVFLRKTVHYTEELDNEISIPCLVSMPLVKQKKRNKKQEYFPSVLEKGTGVVFRENVEALGLRVSKELPDRGSNVLMITSTWENEGKSLISVNLSYMLAKRKKSVLFIDADLRKHNLMHRIGVESYTNLKKIDYSRIDSPDYFVKDPKSNVSFVASQEDFDNISFFLANNLMKIVDKAKKNFDYIIIDTPPSGDFEDTLVMKPYCDGIVYVIKQDYAPKTKILETMSLMYSDEYNDDSSKVIGYVFNGITGLLGDYGYGKYGYGKYGYGKYGYGKYGYGKYGYGKYGYGKYGYGKYGYGSYGYGSYGYGENHKKSES